MLYLPLRTATVIRKRLLPHLPSASGLEIIDEQLFIIGDDSPWLYVLDKEWEIIRQIALFVPEQPNLARIPKKQKPDLEAMTSLRLGGREMLLAIGSGSLSPHRDEGYLVDLKGDFAVKRVFLKRIYDALRDLPEVVGNGKLNIEGLAADKDSLFLLQRGNISGNNTVVRYDLEDFLACVTGVSLTLPTPAITRFELPRMAGIRAGFSGATLVPRTELSRTSPLLFTAAVENTPNEIDDGETLGSFVGLMDPDRIELTPSCVLIEENGLPYVGKVESIAVAQVYADGSFLAVAVTDNDRGDSEILEIRIDR